MGQSYVCMKILEGPQESIDTWYMCFNIIIF